MPAKHPTPRANDVVGNEWVSFPGGELEGERPKARCRSCRRSGRSNTGRTLCFDCYRAGLERERALSAAGRLDTASDERFQSQLPFERVDTVRLADLKRARTAQAEVIDGTARFEAVRRRAQIAARRALDGAGEFPASWLPFVVASGARAT